MGLTTAQLQTLKTEITTDPVTMGYGGKGDEEVAKLLSANQSRSVLNETEIPTWQIFAKLDHAEYKTVMAVSLKASILGNILSMGRVNPADNNLRDALIEVFGPQSKTIQNLASLRNRPGSRAEELGLPAVVTPSDIANARRV